MSYNSAKNINVHQTCMVGNPFQRLVLIQPDCKIPDILHELSEADLEADNDGPAVTGYIPWE